MNLHECDVAIIGCGPTGVVLANLLGALNARTVVLERDAEVFPVPRATHIDEETLRNFQATGLLDLLLPHTSAFGTIEMVDANGRVLFADRVLDPRTPHGYSGSRFFDQPAFERVLRDGLARYPNVTLLTGVEVTEVEDRGGEVTVRAARPGSGPPLTVRGSWAVGCDGGRSLTREARGIEMEPVAPKRPWLIVDTLLKDPEAARLLPGCFQYVMAPERLTIYAHGFGRNRRWEFQLGFDEAAPSREEVLGWVSAYVDLERIEITRIVPYAHTALVAKQWRMGRVLIAGDAAHMMPPSAGQGMCSGIRDAVNLAWKLGEVLSGRAGTDLLDTYERERGPHVREVLKGALFIGNSLTADTPFRRWWRGQQLRFASTVPGIRQVLRKLGLRRPPLRAGFLDKGSRRAGHPLPQVDVRLNGEPRRIDDLLGYRFALVARPGAVDAETVAWATERAIGLWRPGVEFEDDRGHLGLWMDAERIDFALVRPDRCLFAAGGADGLPRVRAEFDRWFERGGNYSMASSTSSNR